MKNSIFLHKRDSNEESVSFNVLRSHWSQGFQSVLFTPMDDHPYSHSLKRTRFHRVVSSCPFKLSVLDSLLPEGHVIAGNLPNILSFGWVSFEVGSFPIFFLQRDSLRCLLGWASDSSVEPTFQEKSKPAESRRFDPAGIHTFDAASSFVQCEKLLAWSQLLLFFVW